MPSPSAPRVLVVDDEPGIRALVDRALRRAGYEVTVASGGPEALRIVAHQPQFDVFVLDLRMPDLPGDELAQGLRQLDPDARVLYLTAYSDLLFRRKLMLWEHEAFLEKPVTVKGLLEAVSLLLWGRIDAGRCPGP